MYLPTADDQARLDNNFTYHAPKDGQRERYVGIRDALKEVAQKLLEECPPSRERSIALTHLEDAMMWANASIARNE